MAADPTGIDGAAEVADADSAPSRSAAHQLSQMRSRFKMAVAAYSDTREDQLDDLRFMAGSPDNHYQWPADVLSTRGSVQGQTINARPCLTINKLPQHVRQVTNEQRQNRPSGKVIPADDNGRYKKAKDGWGLSALYAWMPRTYFGRAQMISVFDYDNRQPTLFG